MSTPPVTPDTLVEGTDITAAEALARLYNRAQPLGMGFLQYKPGNVSTAEAAAWIEATPYGGFDYIAGRVMKIRMSKVVSCDPDAYRLYDRDNGHGAGHAAVHEGVLGSLAGLHPTAGKVAP